MDTQADEIFCSKSKDPALQRNSKSISKGSRTKLAGVITKNALWTSEFDDWEEFIMLLRNWNNPVSTPRLQIQDKMIKVQFQPLSSP
jgi:hypothetical protein